MKPTIMPWLNDPHHSAHHLQRTFNEVLFFVLLIIMKAQKYIVCSCGIFVFSYCWGVSYYFK